MESSTMNVEKESKQYSVSEKLSLSLFKLLDMNYDVTDDSILSKLASFLEEFPLEYAPNLYETIYKDWLIACVSHWKSGTLKPTVAVFSIHVLRTLCSNPMYFDLLNDEKLILEQYQELIEKKLKTNPLFPIAYSKLLTSLISHEKGLDYVVQNELWKTVLSMYITDESLYVKKESREFLVAICAKSCRRSEDDFLKIVSQIFESYEKYRLSGSVFSLKNEYKKYNQILNLLISVLESFLMQQEFGVAKKYFTVRTSFYENLWSDFQTTQSNETLIKIGKLLVINEVLNFKQKESTALEHDHSSNFEEFLAKILIRFLERDSLREVTLMCELAAKYCKVNTKMMESGLLESLLAIRLTPVHVLLQQHSPESEKMAEDYSFLYSKFLNNFSEGSLRNFITLFKQTLTAHSNLESVAISSMIALESEFDCALLPYKMLVFNVLTTLFHQYFVPKDTDSSIIPFSNFTESRLTSTLLLQLKNSIIRLGDFLDYEQFRKLLSDMVMFLSIPGLPPNSCTAPALSVVCHILKSLPKKGDEHVISKPLQPNLESVLLKYLYSNSWEVRDSTLEVLSSYAELVKKSASNSVISLQLAEDVLDIFLSDSEYYVRASAIACLCNLVTVDGLWSQMNQNSVVRKLLDAIISEDEAIVRRQFPLLFTEIYKNGGFPVNLEGEVFSTLSSVCTKDLHWEVCINTLIFWQAVMMHHLEVSASMPNAEIRSFFVKQLTQLNNLGCFRVLINCLYNEADLEVCKRAAVILDELSSHLNRYLSSNMEQRLDLCHALSCTPSAGKFQSPNSDALGPKFTHEQQNSNGQDAKAACLSDEVIDSIVGSKDINLLAGVYKNLGNWKPDQVISLNSDTSTLTESELVDLFTKINAAEVVEAKILFFKQSQNNLESLLNDILLPGFNNAENPTLDCY
nr:PREDICTED: uncharacterized protein LOC109042724 [Bemisia tabaci]